jgi:hypothetical protein
MHSSRRDAAEILPGPPSSLFAQKKPRANPPTGSLHMAREFSAIHFRGDVHVCIYAKRNDPPPPDRRPVVALALVTLLFHITRPLNKQQKVNICSRVIITLGMETSSANSGVCVVCTHGAPLLNVDFALARSPRTRVPLPGAEVFAWELPDRSGGVRHPLSGMHS